MLRITQNYMEDQRLLASVALFRTLYDNEKDSYDVLTEFLRAAINIKSLWIFTVEECSHALKSSFGFRIPAAVLKSCLRRRLKGEVVLSHGKFSVTDSFVRSEGIQAKISVAQEEQEAIIYELINFASNLIQRPMSRKEEEDLRNDFYRFFLGGLKPSQNHVYISQYILSNSTDTSFTEKLNHLEEGLILYQGIEYSPKTGEMNTWRAHCTIFLDTEILFWANGYDGALFQSIFMEFMELVREINSKASPTTRIVLKYFPETKREVDSLFNAAENILSGGRFSDPSKTAMQYLLNGCQSPSDVIAKKGMFYSFLARYSIVGEEERDYYNPPDFNCENADLLERLAIEFPEAPSEKIANTLRLFTKINYLRKGKSDKGLEQSKAILISGKNLSRNLAFHPAILISEGDIPYSTDLEYLTERLWFKLGRGFGGGQKMPIAFDVVSRAQVIISTQVCSKVANEYKSLISKVSNGEMSANDASYIVNELKNRSVKPEEVVLENLDCLSSFLDTASVEASVRNMRVLEAKASDLESKLEVVTQALESLNRENSAARTIALRLKIEKLKRKVRQGYWFSYVVILVLLVIACGSSVYLLSADVDSKIAIVSLTIAAASLFYQYVLLPLLTERLRKRARTSLRKSIRKCAPESA